MTPGESIPDFPPTPEDQQGDSAWQPLTPRGVAAFAQATLGRLLLVESISALLAAAAVVWFLAAAWFPTVRQAIRQLPQQGVIRQQHLISSRSSATPLAASRLLAFVVNVEDRRPGSLPSDVIVKFHKNDFQICSLFGCLVFAYPKEYSVGFNRPELEPWWGAWEPIILGMAVIAVVAALLLNWAILATLGFVVVRLIAFFKDRKLSWPGSWRLASAAFVPGTLLLIGAIVLYGLEMIDLIHFLLLLVLHFVVGWIYLIASPLTLRRSSGAAALPANPFAPPPPPTQT
jgi:hypothetical protein